MSRLPESTTNWSVPPTSAKPTRTCDWRRTTRYCLVVDAFLQRAYVVHATRIHVFQLYASAVGTTQLLAGCRRLQVRLMDHGTRTFCSATSLCPFAHALSIGRVT